MVPIQMPSVAVSTAQTMVSGSPCISRLGDTANRNGTMYAAQPMRVAVHPVLSTSAPAANIAGADVDKTGWTATRIGWAAYIVPFLFAVSPSLLMHGDPLTIVWAVVTAALGIWMGTVGVVGHYSGPIRPAV